MTVWICTRPKIDSFPDFEYSYLYKTYYSFLKYKFLTRPLVTLHPVMPLLASRTNSTCPKNKIEASTKSEIKIKFTFISKL